MKHLPSLAAALLFLASASAQETPNPLRAGIIGLDTSHVPAFTKLFNGPKADGDLAGIKVVVGYPGGTDMPASATRVEKFTQNLRDIGVEIVDTIPKLLEKVDVVLLESVDGRIHLKEAREVFKAGKPVFIDKPLGGNLPEAIAIVELAKKHKVPFFSSSSFRFGEGLRSLIESPEIGEIVGATTWGPCSYQEGTPDLYFYGVHGVEGLFTIMGTGCETVARTKSKTHDQVTGVWKNDRVGTYRGILKGKSDSGAVVYGDKGIVQTLKASAGYEPLCRQIGKFFRTLQPPVSAEETIEIFTFMEAADESLRQGGKPVSMAEVYAKAKAEAEKLMQ
jgi:predicted dehydrogenase